VQSLIFEFICALIASARQTNWDSDSDDDNSSEREELPTIVRVEKNVKV